MGAPSSATSASPTASSAACADANAKKKLSPWLSTS
jgi:hypothetical protein